MNPYAFTVFGNKATFLGSDGNDPNAFWSTDGTVAGTHKIITPALPDGSLPSFFLPFGSRLLFRANGADLQDGLWVTDGTDADTQEIVVPLIRTSPYITPQLAPIPLVAFGNKALFIGYDGVNEALWVTDGTSAGTRELSTPGLKLDSTVPGQGGSVNPTNFFAWGNRVLFQGEDSAGRVGLWITDGTSTGTTEITPSNAYSLGLHPSGFSFAGAGVVFQGTDAAGHVGVWVTDGTAAGTQELVTTSGSAPQYFASFNTNGSTTPGQIILHGSSAQYVIADNNGALHVQDTVVGRDGTQTLYGVNAMVFSDGTGVFDPTGSAESVSRVYQATLGRASDVGGLEYWAKQIDDSNVPLAAVANSFATSPEFITRYGSLPDPAFVNQLYENVLGRSTDAAGAQYWGSLLASGASRGSVVLGFAESPENEAKTVSVAGDTNNAEAYRLYQAALNRAPDAGGLTYWATALGGGATSAQVAQGFIDSAEFQQHYGSLSAPDFVSTLYQNVLHRAPDSAGQQYWTGLLQRGSSEASVLVGFSDSLENRTQTASATHANWAFIPN